MGKGLDLSQFKKVQSGKKHTVLRHPEGHEITIFHKALSKPIKAQLDKLEQHTDDKHREVHNNDLKGNPKLQQAQIPHMAEGGAFKKLSESINNAMPEGLKTQQNEPKEESNEERYKRIRMQNTSNVGQGIRNYAEGGKVTPDPVKTQTVQDSMRKAFHFEGGGTPSLPGAQSAQDSMRKAFKFAKGGVEQVQGQEQQVPASILESQYGPEDAAAQGQADADAIGREIPNVDPNAPITPVNQDNSHAHLSEAIKNLSQKFIPQAPNSAQPIQEKMSIDNQVSLPSGPMAQATDSGASKGTLPEQALANTSMANRAEMAQAKNTQQTMGQEAIIHGQEAQQMQDLRGKYEEIGNNLHHKFETVSQEVEQGKINPHQWWNSKSTGSQILTAIGMLFGGAGAGISGHPEMASQAIDKAIERDVEAQKANLQNKNTLLSKYLEMYNSLPQAEAAARLTMSAGIEGLLKQQATKLGSSNAVNAALQSIAGRRQALLPQMEGLAKGQIMMDYMHDQGQNSQVPGEQGFMQDLDKTRSMAMINPAFKERASEMESRYIPGVGQARIPVDKIRDELTARKDLSDKLAKLENFASEHSGSWSPETIAQGKVLAGEAQNAYRTGTKQGVFKEGDQHFIESLIPSDPTKYFGDMRTIPKYHSLRESNNSTLNHYLKSYGVKPFSGENEPQSSQNQAAKQWLNSNPNDPRAAAVRKKLGL